MGINQNGWEDGAEYGIQMQGDGLAFAAMMEPALSTGRWRSARPKMMCCACRLKTAWGPSQIVPVISKLGHWFKLKEGERAEFGCVCMFVCVCQCAWMYVRVHRATWSCVQPCLSRISYSCVCSGQIFIVSLIYWKQTVVMNKSVILKSSKSR